MEWESDCRQLIHNARLFAEIYIYDMLHHDRMCGTVKKCLELGADINAVDRNNGDNTVLHVAVIRKSESLVGFLLANGAKPDIRNKEGFTPIDLAKLFDCDNDIVELLEKHSQHEINGEHRRSTSLAKNGPLAHFDKMWNNLRAKPKASYIEIDCRESDQPILHGDNFYRTVELFENLILIDVLISDKTTVDDNVVMHHLKPIKCPIIIQCRSSSTAKVYFKELQRSPGFIDLNSVPMEVDQDYFLERLKAKESFGMNLILEGLIQNVFGKFNTENQKSLLDLCFLEKLYNGLRLIDYAVQHGHLLVVRWLRLELYKVQWSPTVYPVTTMGRDMLAALLKIEFPIPIGNIQLSADVVQYFKTFKEEHFKNAAYNQRQDLIEFLLQCTNDMDHKDLISSIFKRKCYIVALVILKADGLYPDNFNSGEVDDRIPGGPELIDFIRQRNELHDLINISTLKNIKNHFSTLYKSKLFLNTKNESAVATALRNKKFDIYRYLLSQRVDFKDNTERQLLFQLDFNVKCRLREQMIQSIGHVGESSIDYLLSRTRLPSFQLDVVHRQQIRHYYELLNEIPEISIILAVVQYSDYLDIIFDFDHESTIEMDPMNSHNEGLYYPALGRIYIGAKGDEKRLLGLIAHELTHLAMQLVYSNECKPYFKDDIVAESTFSKLVKETNRLHCAEPVISVVFNTASCEAVKEAELIVRINHILAIYGLENGEAKIKSQVLRLSMFYQSKVMPQCQAFVFDSHLIKMRKNVEILNSNSGIVKYANESIIRFKSQIDLKGFLQSNDKQIILFNTGNPLGITTQICHNLKDIKLNEDELTFLNLEDLNFKSGFNAPHVFVLTASFNLNVDQESNTVFEWVKLIFRNPHTKLVLVLNDRYFDKIKTGLQCVVPDKTVEIRNDEDLELEKFLNSDEPLFIYQTKTVRLSMIAIYQLLKMWFCTCDNCFAVLKFEEFCNTYIDNKPVLMSGACKVIVLESSLNSNDFPKGLVTWFKYAVVESGKKFIVVTPVSMDCLMAPLIGSVQHSKIIHSISLNDLTVDSRESLLNCEVKFQGKWVKMKELIKTSSYDAVDADTIIKLANKEVVDIGKELPIVETFYVPRTLRYGAKIKSEWVKNYLKYENLISKDIAVCCESKSVQIIYLDSSNENHFHELCEQHPNMDIHYLKRNGDDFSWKESKSTPTGFMEFQKSVNKELTEDLSEDSFIGQLDEHRLVIVSDVAGMGKTTLLTHIARLLKDKHPFMWIVQVNLNMHTEVLDEEARNPSFNDVEMEKAMNFLNGKLLWSTIKTNLEIILIEECIRSSGSIAFLFDAFDELKEEQQKVIIKLIKCLQKTKVKQMWVTTRPHMSELLESELLQLSLSLVSFTENAQLECVTKIWMQKLSNKIRVEKFAKALLKRFNDCISDKEREFTGIPLQSFLLAQAFESECRAFHDSTDEEPHLPTRLKLTDLYKHFVNTKFDICQFLKTGIKPSTPVADSNKKRLYPDYLKDHQLLALFTLFDELQRGNLLNNERKIDNVDEIAKTLFPYGIINKMICGQPQFVHRTFAEYFTAEFIVARFQSKEKDEIVIGYLVGQILGFNNFKTVQIFIDMLLSDIEPYSLDLGIQLGDPLTSEQLWLSLFAATREANLNIFKLIINSVKGLCNVNCPDAAEVFFLAIRLHRLEVMKLLISVGYDVNRKYLDRGFYHTPLCEAVICDSAELCEWLLQNGAKSDIRLDSVSSSISGERWRIWRGCTALHIACMFKQLAPVSVLLKYKSDVNATDVYGLTPLHIAAMSALKDTVALLVENKADINAVNAVGYTPLDEAIRWLRMEVVDYMVNLEGLDVNATNGSGLTPLHVAAVYGDQDIVQLLINHDADIHSLVNIEKARTIKDDLWQLTKYLKSPTDHAAVTPLFLAKLCINEDAVEVFKRHGTSDVNVMTLFKWGLYEYNGHYKLIRKLIQTWKNRAVDRDSPLTFEMFNMENELYRYII